VCKNRLTETCTPAKARARVVVLKVILGTKSDNALVTVDGVELNERKNLLNKMKDCALCALGATSGEAPQNLQGQSHAHA
jgi:hypothetical protein